jgi:opacity protein-like surface antigen
MAHPAGGCRRGIGSPPPGGEPGGRTITTPKTLVVVALATLGSLPAVAQHKDWKSWYGEVSAGYAVPMLETTAPDGSSVDPLDDGWNLTLGGVYKPKTWPVGAYLELGYNSFDVNRDLLDQIDVGGGDADIWSLDGGFFWTTTTGTPVNFYIRGGVGWYRIEAKLTEPGAGFLPGWCGWNWCYPGGIVPTDVVVASDSTTRFGYNAGLGLSFAFGSGSEIYLEARYHRAETTNEPTELLPVSVGFRW